MRVVVAVAPSNWPTGARTFRCLTSNSVMSIDSGLCRAIPLYASLFIVSGYQVTKCTAGGIDLSGRGDAERVAKWLPNADSPDVENSTVNPCGNDNTQNHHSSSEKALPGKRGLHVQAAPQYMWVHGTCYGTKPWAPAGPGDTWTGCGMARLLQRSKK